MAEYVVNIEQLENEKPILVHSHLTNSENQIEKFKIRTKMDCLHIVIFEGVDIKRLRLWFIPFHKQNYLFAGP